MTMMTSYAITWISLHMISFVLYHCMNLMILVSYVRAMTRPCCGDIMPWYRSSRNYNIRLWFHSENYDIIGYQGSRCWVTQPEPESHWHWQPEPEWLTPATMTRSHVSVLGPLRPQGNGFISPTVAGHHWSGKPTMGPMDESACQCLGYLRDIL